MTCKLQGVDFSINC